MTAPLVRPATMRRWKSSTRTTTGIVTITAAAAMAPVGSTNCDSPENRPIAAAAVVVTIPVIILVLLFQRRIVAGLTNGAVKG